MSAPEAYIVAIGRTAGGRRKGRLSGWHPVDLGAAAIDGLLAQHDLDPGLVEDVMFGCVSQAGEQSTNVARNVALASRLPQTTPGVSIDRQCGSSQQALHFAAQAVMSGAMDVVIAGGVENMTRVPMGMPVALPEANGLGTYMSPGIQAAYPGPMFSQFTGAGLVAQRYGFARPELDAFALESHRKAARATDEGAFEAEIVVVEGRGADGATAPHREDEGIRRDATLEAIGAVQPLSPDGVISAANASQMCDGASAAIIANARGLKALGAEPLARVHAMSVIGGDPVVMLDEPAPATERVLERAALRLADIDLYEVNEAFAPIPLAWLKRLGADPERMNVHGGAIALGHPLGATGVKLMATLVHGLRRHGGRYGLLTMCEGGGMANATVVERL